MVQHELKNTTRVRQQNRSLRKARSWSQWRDPGQHASKDQIPGIPRCTKRPDRHRCSGRKADRRSGALSPEGRDEPIPWGLTAGLVLSFAMPYREITLGPAYSIRLQDLAASDVVNVTCATCRATWFVPPHQLFAKYNGYTWLKEISRCFSCTKCPSRECTWKVLRAYHDVNSTI